ncbi:hypothetical protein HBI56_119020 [Parastagonospora nodorum]|uniref:Uncharacterized protein n=1 Tax=Phaeosphaeria nodorum (strain SN15 / ATCC MYA-4574 / FGSC 10173) TaxID=321614 RepID=A0A7U2I3W4_PHANO|nr:hypothetical protein HBH56_055740 [Parastagonospora nodorum]QRD02421.1 hypothetical protein JI435_303780 [Parastagonospora nodorum SN15]KAH3935543.1 hypothetical protein HBH54_041550 [Parastagonospora nodorum]KAH3948661.1 hypothetical protein HBH53_097750 [Parastagonospora nodorum]KAH3969879.1 hypothetical protein HBH51_121680 [Parastagonospora nodorum]
MLRRVIMACSRGVLTPSDMTKAYIRVRRSWWTGTTSCNTKDDDTHWTEFASFGWEWTVVECEWQSQLMVREALVEWYDESTA